MVISRSCSSGSSFPEQRGEEPVEVLGVRDDRARGLRPGDGLLGGVHQRQRGVVLPEVTARVRPGEGGPRVDVRRVLQPQRREDALPVVRGDGRARHLLDDRAQRDEVGVGVAVRGARRVVQRLRRRQVEQLLVAEDLVPHRLEAGDGVVEHVVGVVVQPAAVAQQVTDRDALVGQRLGQVAVGRRVEVDRALGDELQQHHRGEGLADAAHTEPPPGVHRRVGGGVGLTGGDVVAPRPLVDPGQRAGRALGQRRPVHRGHGGDVGRRQRGRGGAGRGRGRRQGDDQGGTDERDARVFDPHPLLS